MKYTSLKPGEVVVVMLFIVGAVWVITDLMALKADLDLFKAYLTSSQVPSLCPHPGQPAAMICHYTLQIKGPYEPDRGKDEADKHKGETDKHGWFTAVVPEQILSAGHADCKALKGNFSCVDPKFYPRFEYVIYVAGDVKKDETWHFVNDPPTNHLIAKEKVELASLR